MLIFLLGTSRSLRRLFYFFCISRVLRPFCLVWVLRAIENFYDTFDQHALAGNDFIGAILHDFNVSRILFYYLFHAGEQQPSIT
jgi:hypothetical protein